MDSSLSAKWLSDFGMDEFNIIHQCHMNSLAELTTNTTATAAEKPTKQLETCSSWNSTTTAIELVPYQKPSSPAATSQILSFEKPASVLPSNSDHPQFYNIDINALKPKDEMGRSGNNMNFSTTTSLMITNGPYYENTVYAAKINKGTFKSSHLMTRSPSHAKDHIIAERKRREKLSQRLIALSAIVPGLKKMDKASVLGDAVKHVKQLQERLKVLEEQTRKRTVESVVFVKKSRLSADDETSSSERNSVDGLSSDAALPEIEARVSDDDVLIRIHCEEHKGLVAKILSEIENLHLSVVNSSVLPFGSSTLDITIIAQKEDEFKLTMTDLVKDLRVALLKFI